MLLEHKRNEKKRNAIYVYAGLLACQTWAHCGICDLEITTDACDDKSDVNKKHCSLSMFIESGWSMLSVTFTWLPIVVETVRLPKQDWLSSCNVKTRYTRAGDPLFVQLHLAREQFL